MRFAAAFATATLVVTACASEPERVTYGILITEPSGNIGDGIRGNGERLIGHWSCDETVDPATFYLGTQDALWTSTEGQLGEGVLRLEATCRPGDLLTVLVDGAVVQPLASRPTQLRCEVFNAEGERVADQTIIRGQGPGTAICRVIVPSK